MDLEKRMEVLAKWGDALADQDWLPAQELIEASNPWFTAGNIQLALRGVQQLLDLDKMRDLTNRYSWSANGSRTILIIPAANLPLVGFHDLLCVLLSGHKAVIKLSSRDKWLLPAMCQLLSDKPLGAALQLVFKPPKLPDALIASGGDNTARYLKYQFPGVPHIIRQNRTSQAILKSGETSDSLKRLGMDIFSYFGKGCRNISKLWIPHGFDIEVLKDSFQSYESILETVPYANNYRHQKAFLKTANQPYFDLGFAVMQEHIAAVSPIASLYYQRYQSIDELTTELGQISHKIQCLTSQGGWFPNSIPFGRAQFPEIWDFADKIDTLEFLSSLS